MIRIKSVLLMLGFVATLFLASCTHKTCPTYSKELPKQPAQHRTV
ncbi:MAG: hypothetical protein ACFCUI_05905 [Bernardetiaceae bacterium]